MGDFMGIVGSVLSGGITGILGTAITGILGYFKQKEINRQTLALKKLDNEMLDKQIAAGYRLEELRKEKAIEGATIDREKAVELADVKLMQTSMRDPEYLSGEKIRNSLWVAPFFVLMDIIKAGIRPVLTIYLVVLVADIYDQLLTLMGPDTPPLTQSETAELVKYIIYTIVYLTTTCVLWWFGSRVKAKMFESIRMR